ncbi:CDP-alcohol phosphatidyltransferase family protein [Thermoproteus tenax]|uniref:CDP-diacylglycerol--glycerol-3-phosphate 3-phosphatidyltransferase n=1 Tax=Thermoproteus tenax (strain ATCC 35583 / DSM 2078 / JCM 9277 / NBRC 100435 / Kra 1) TaxID=768679 RepID=G4RML2_THETK|nr:CDP-alcohol phosphatidyltransferase family protein [Thermoproteus tenax]CCC80843.1 CDP-diacylglycerol--glycerol-3-phosphate 3-phosphatidyltransferase [Thermoproteus tenax Kra 1]
MIERLRKYVKLEGIGRRVPLSADVVTMLSLGVALAGVYLTWKGAPGWIFIAAVGILDAIDGAVARAKGTAGRRGALLDSSLDRYADAAILLYFAQWAPLWVLYAALVGTFLISYVRARAESLGLAMRGIGLMERGERIIYLFAASLLGWLTPSIIAPALYVYTIVVNAAAVYRLVAAYRMLKSDGR